MSKKLMGKVKEAGEQKLTLDQKQAIADVREEKEKRASADDRTLNEMAKDDLDQLEQARKAAELHRFRDQRQALKFQGACLQVALRQLGVDLTAQTIPEVLDRAMEEKGVTVESRAYDAEEDFWRTGFYVYAKDGELAFFISNLKTTGDESPLAITPKNWGILTNVKVEKKTIYNIPKTVQLYNKGA